MCTLELGLGLLVLDGAAPTPATTTTLPWQFMLTLLCYTHSSCDRAHFLLERYDVLSRYAAGVSGP